MSFQDDYCYMILYKPLFGEYSYYIKFGDANIDRLAQRMSEYPPYIAIAVDVKNNNTILSAAKFLQNNILNYNTNVFGQSSGLEYYYVKPGQETIVDKIKTFIKIGNIPELHNTPILIIDNNSYKQLREYC